MPSPNSLPASPAAAESTLPPIPPGLRSLLYFTFAVCPLLFFTDLTRNPYYTQIALLNIFMALCAVLFLVDAFRKKQWFFVISALDVPLLAVFAISVLSWGISLLQHPHLWKSLYSEGSRGAIFLILNTYIVYQTALRSQDEALLKKLLWLTYAVSVVASIYGIAQYFGYEWVWPHNLNPYGSRPVSTFGNPNFMSSFLVLVIPVLVADFLFRATGVPRVILFASIFACTAALTATLTRSSWLGLVLALLVLGAGCYSMPEFRPRLKKYGVGLLSVLVILAFFWPKSSGGTYSATVLDRLGEVRSATAGHYGPVSQRFLIWISAWTMVEDHPLMGKGWGTFELFFPFYQGRYLLTTAFQGFRTHANNCHNEVLEYWSQIGSLGLGLVVLLWIVFFKLVSSYSKRLFGGTRAILWGIAAGVGGMLFDNLLNVSVHFAVPAFLFWWWVGSAFVLVPEARKVRRLEATSASARAVLVLASLIFIGFAVRAGFMWAGEVAFFEGFKLSKGGANLALAQKDLQKAYAWHHMEVNNNYELANVEARMGFRDDALAMYQRALDANAGYDEIYFNRATMFMQQNQDERAIASYRTALAINPISHDAYNALATLYIKDLKSYGDAAEALYRQGVMAFPNDKDMWNNLGYLYTKREQWEQAYQAYRKAIEIDPEFDLARKNLKSIASHTAGHERDVALSLDESYGEINRLMSVRQWDAALQKTIPLAQGFPRSFTAHFYLGNIYFSMNRLSEAQKEYGEATRLRADAAPAWQNLGVTCDRLGQSDQAVAAFRHLLQIDPNNAAAKARVNKP